MKTTTFVPRHLLKAFAIAGVAVLFCSSSEAATTLVAFGFNAAGGGNNIDEAAGWDGTSIAAGGSIDANIVLTSALKIAGGYVAGNGTDVFHVDNWHSTDLATAVTAGKKVSFTITPQAGYVLNLGDGTGVLSTQMHSHTQGGDLWEIFDKVSLYVAGTFVATTDYIHNGLFDPGVQILTWSVGSMPALNGLTSATEVALYFWDSTSPGYEPGIGDDAHGPQWDVADGAYINLVGTLEAVPEPSRALLGFVGLAFTFLRRRR